MDASELAQAMLRWEQAKAELDKIETEIKSVVFVLGKTQTVGNVKATYSKGRKTYRYEEAAHDHMMVSDVTLAMFSTTETKVDWRKLCKHVGIDDVPFTQGGPSVSVKLVV